MMKGSVIQLTPDLYNDACVIGRARYENNRQHGVLKIHINGVNPIKGDVEGVAGELAFAQLVNADTTEIRRIGVTCSTNDTGDVLFNGHNIDVKTTRYDDGHLLVYAHKLKNEIIDGYVLMTGANGHYIFRGYISREDIIKGVDAGHFTMQSRSTYWIPQNALQDLAQCGLC